MEEQADKCPNIASLTEEQWQEINDKLDAIQARLNKLFGNEELLNLQPEIGDAQKNKTSGEKQ